MDAIRLTPQRLTVLQTLEHGEQPTRVVARALQVVPNNAGCHLRKLQKLGAVQSRPERVIITLPSFRRHEQTIRLWSLTPEGRAVLASAHDLDARPQG